MNTNEQSMKQEKKEAFIAEFEKALKGIAEGHHIEVEFNRMPVVKPGLKYDGLSMRIAGDNFAATANLDRLFDCFEEGQSAITLAADFLGAVMERRDSDKEKIVGFERLINVDNLIPVMIQEKGNDEIFETCPNRPFLNMRIIAKLSDGTASCLVNNDLVRTLEMTETEVIDRAISNSIRKGHCVFDLPSFLFGKGGIPKDGEGFDRISGNDMICLTNHTQRYGADCLLDRSFLKKVSDHFGGNCFIIPSSIHEVLAIPCKGMDKEDLGEMIQGVNSAEVQPEDRLSDTPYILECGELRIA